MSHYRTEIVVPPDRYVCLQLPANLPEGPAFVTVHFGPYAPDDHGTPAEIETDRQDIEWWNEFEPDVDPSPVPFED